MLTWATQFCSNLFGSQIYLVLGNFVPKLLGTNRLGSQIHSGSLHFVQWVILPDRNAGSQSEKKFAHGKTAAYP